MVHRLPYPWRRRVHALWLIWMTTLAVGVAIAMTLMLAAGVALFVLAH